jgi:hypothetical protein
MKTILFTVLAFGMNSAFASVLEEAICTGSMQGEEIKVTSFVNPENWCETNPTNDMNTVVTIEFSEGPAAVFATVMSIPAEGEVVHTSTYRGAVEMRLSYGYTNSNNHTLEMEDENGVLKTYTIKCEFPQYNIVCEGDEQ